MKCTNVRTEKNTTIRTDTFVLCFFSKIFWYCLSWSLTCLKFSSMSWKEKITPTVKYTFWNQDMCIPCKKPPCLSSKCSHWLPCICICKNIPFVALFRLYIKRDNNSGLSGKKKSRKPCIKCKPLIFQKPMFAGYSTRSRNK